jgi:hypothetical protein
MATWRRSRSAARGSNGNSAEYGVYARRKFGQVFVHRRGEVLSARGVLRHVRSGRAWRSVPFPEPDRRGLRVDASVRHQHGSHLYRSEPGDSRRGGRRRAPRHGRAPLVAARRVSRRCADAAGYSRGRERRRAPGSGSSGSPDDRARQRDPRRGGPMARPGARRAFSPRALRGRQGHGAGDAVHVCELPADGISGAAVPRRLLVQRLPAQRGQSPPLRGAAAARRGDPPAAARRGGRRQHSRRARRAGGTHGDADPRGLRRGRLRRHRLCLDRRVVARRAGG